MDSSGSVLLSIAYIFNSLCCIYPLLEIVHEGKSGKTHKIRYSSLLCNYLVMSFWLVYSLVTNDYQLIFGNSFGLLLCFICLLVHSHYTKTMKIVLFHTGICIFFAMTFMLVSTELIRIACSLACLFFIAEIKDEIKTMRKEKDCKSIDFIGTLLFFANELVWTLYLYREKDFLLLFPFVLNTIGSAMVIGFYQYFHRFHRNLLRVH